MAAKAEDSACSCQNGAANATFPVTAEETKRQCCFGAVVCSDVTAHDLKNKNFIL